MFDHFDWDAKELVFVRDIPEFTIDKLLKATKKLSSGKVGGPQVSPTRY